MLLEPESPLPLELLLPEPALDPESPDPLELLELALLFCPESFSALGACDATPQPITEMLKAVATTSASLKEMKFVLKDTTLVRDPCFSNLQTSIPVKSQNRESWGYAERASTVPGCRKGTGSSSGPLPRRNHKSGGLR